MRTRLKDELTTLCRKAREASRVVAALSSEAKNAVLADMASALNAHQGAILEANKKDTAAAVRRRSPASFIDRLTLDQARIAEMAASLLELTKLADPIGEEMRSWVRPNGLKIRKVRAPIGVIAIIYESRPNVTSDCMGLCFKSGNSVILKGGSEAIRTNAAIFKVLRQVLKKHGIPEDAVAMVMTTDREAVGILLKQSDHIDLVIPRGGESLIRRVTASSRIPVIKHYKGICHTYVDEWADLNMAERVCFNAKVQRPGVCNAMESMLVHRDVAARFLPGMLKRFMDAGVEIRGCAFTRKIFKGARAAREQDYRTEYLDLILSVKVVGDVHEAVRHINEYGSHHSDTIITDDPKNSEEFLRCVDSACVYVNASTRFTDGYQFGMGAEIGISTDKLHARGPMSLEELTTYKYMVYGTGQVRT